jgi:hypothetical protein
LKGYIICPWSLHDRAAPDNPINKPFNSGSWGDETNLICRKILFMFYRLLLMDKMMSYSGQMLKYFSKG